MKIKWKIVSLIVAGVLIVPAVTVTNFLISLDGEALDSGADVSSITAYDETLDVASHFEQLQADEVLPDVLSHQSLKDSVSEVQKVLSEDSEAALAQEIQQANAIIEKMDQLVADLPPIESITPASEQEFDQEYDELQQELERLRTQAESIDLDFPQI